MNSTLKTMVEDLDYVIEKAKACIKVNGDGDGGTDRFKSKNTATLLEAIRNATFTKSSVIQSMDSIGMNIKE